MYAESSYGNLPFHWRATAEDDVRPQLRGRDCDLSPVAANATDREYFVMPENSFPQSR